MVLCGLKAGFGGGVGYASEATWDPLLLTCLLLLVWQLLL